MSSVAVVTGGATPERNVALAGASQVMTALRRRGYQVTVVDTVRGALSRRQEGELSPAVGAAPPSLPELADLEARELRTELASLPALRAADLAFLVLHGRQGEGGLVQALLELAGIPYTGSGPIGSALAMDKEVAKRLLRAARIPTPEWLAGPHHPDAVERLGLPLVVKPVKVGSTVGLTVVRSPEQLAPAIAEALSFDDEVILERFLPGREFTVGILGDRALAVGEIVPRHEIFDYECKYTPGMTDEIFPAPISEPFARRMQDLAVAAHRCLKLRDFSRVDLKLDAAGEPACLEVNTLPGLTTGSLLPQSAAAVGIGFDDLCERICALVLERTAAMAGS